MATGTYIELVDVGAESGDNYIAVKSKDDGKLVLKISAAGIVFYHTDGTTKRAEVTMNGAVVYDAAGGGNAKATLEESRLRLSQGSGATTRLVDIYTSDLADGDTAKFNTQAVCGDNTTIKALADGSAA